MEGMTRACILTLLATLATNLCAQEVKKISKAETVAAVVRRVQPEYPTAARQLKMEGMVELKIVIDEAGGVERVAIVSGNPVLTKAASEAVKQWKFAPAKDEGKAVKAEGTINITFKL